MAALAAVTLLSLAGCATDEPAASPSGSASAAAGSGTGEQSKFFVQADYDAELALLGAHPTGPADKPWEQVLNPTMVDTAKFKKAGPHKICFSNAALNNPWRQVGFKTMQAEVEAQKSRIKRVRARRRRGQGPEADRGHQRPARQGLRRAHRLAEHHRHAHPGRRGGLQGRACRSSSSTVGSTRSAR